MRKLNIKMLTTVSAAAMLVASTSFAADTYVDSSSLNSDDWNEIYQWNELLAEGALGAAIIDATQIASIYAVEINDAVIDAGDTAYIEQSYWTESDDSSYDAYDDYAGLTLGAGNGLYALTTRNDALVDGVTQVASVAFQTASLDITGSVEGLSTIDIIQTVDGQGYSRDYEGTYAFGIVADNNIAAVAAFQGTAVIDGQVLNADEELVNGVQQAIVSLNTLSVTADDGNDVVINLNDGQALDTYGVSGGEDYWDGENVWTDWEQFTLEATNQAFAYAPHPVIANDPAVKNLDQVAAVTLNSISVGVADGTANFTIGDTEGFGVGDNYASQHAEFNGNDNNLSINFGATYWDWGNDSNYSNEINVRNAAVATTELDVFYWTGAADLGSFGDGDGENLGAWVELGYDLGYQGDGVGDVALESVSQVASIGINSVTNRGTGDLKLTSTDVVGFEGYWATDDMDFDQVVANFEFEGYAFDANSNYSNYSNYWWGRPNDEINFALALTDVGDVTLDGVDQTTSFSFNSIRSGGDLIGWTELDEGVDSRIRQYADTDIFASTPQTIDGSSDDGDIFAQDLSQTLALSSNTITANGNIRADISQDSYAEWDIYRGNEIELDVEEGALTGGNLSQTMALTINSLSTRDVVDDDGEIVTPGGNLVTADVDQYAYYTALNDVTYNDIDIDGDGDNTSVDLGEMSQIALINMNSVDIAGDITIGDAYDGGSGLLYQEGTSSSVGSDNFFGNSIRVEEIAGNASIGSADNNSVQAAYLNVNSVSAGGTLSGNVEQQTIADYYVVGNRVAVDTFEGVASVANFAQVAQVNLNEVTAAVFDGADISQYNSNGVEIIMYNTLSAISDIGSVNVDGIVQQATARVNSISGL
jgi:hypothetical protein